MVLEANYWRRAKLRSLPVVTERAAFVSFGRMRLRCSSTLTKVGSLPVSSPTKSITIPCSSWLSPVRAVESIMSSSGRAFVCSWRNIAVSLIGRAESVFRCKPDFNSQLRSAGDLPACKSKRNAHDDVRIRTWVVDFEHSYAGLLTEGLFVFRELR